MLRTAWNGSVPSTVLKAAVLSAAFVLLAGIMPARASDEEPAPPEGQTYTGSKRCAACHFDEYMSWRKTGHAKAFEILTPKYQKDEKCLKCHTTGFGEATGYKDGEAALAGITCESCHGPGSIHEEVSKPFAKVKKLSPEQEKITRDSIWRMKPGNVCIECHGVQAHKKS